MSYKNIFNSTPQPLKVSLLPRVGDNPDNNGPVTEEVVIMPGQEFTFNYGDNNNPFLNGITIAVAERGSPWDDTLNSNSTLILSEDMLITGRN